MKDKYRLREGRKTHKRGGISTFYFVCRPNVPDLYPSLFVANHSKNSIRYGKSIGYRLTRFFNFLLDRNTEYWEATDSDIKAYMMELINFDQKSGEIIDRPDVTYATIQKHKSTIVQFYKFLWQFSDHSVLQISKWDSNTLSEYKTALTLRWNAVETIADATIDLFLTKYKTSRKEYIMEYTDEEMKAIYTNFSNYRNRAIFLCTLHGMRIDEVLSVKLRDYSPIDNTVRPSRSKGTGRGRKRTVVLGDEVVKIIENYIRLERSPAEIKAKKHNDFLFVNTRQTDGKIAFDAYTASSYRSALKTAARKAGITENVRTHSGRSDKATKLVRGMVSGELKLSDEIIRQIMGWRSPESIAPYIDHNNEEISRNFARKHASELSEKLLKLQEELGD